MSVTPEQSFPCTECQAGHMRRRLVTYFTWLEDELITVPDFPSWVCDVCGRREYDMQAISQLSMLLNPNAGRPPARRSNAASKSSGKTRPTRSSE